MNEYKYNFDETANPRTNDLLNKRVYLGDKDNSLLEDGNPDNMYDVGNLRRRINLLVDELTKKDARIAELEDLAEEQHRLLAYIQDDTKLDHCPWCGNDKGK